MGGTASETAVDRRSALHVPERSRVSVLSSWSELARCRPEAEAGGFGIWVNALSLDLHFVVSQMPVRRPRRRRGDGPGK